MKPVRTTQMMIEVLVVGLTFLLGLVPLLLWTALYPGQLQTILIRWQGWVPVISIALVALAYQVGWVVNGIAYFALERPFERRRLNKVFGWDHLMLGDAEKEFRQVFATVLSNDQGGLAEVILKDLSATRLSRTGVVNWTLIGVSVALWLDSWIVAYPIFGLAVVSYLYSGYRIRRFFEFVKNARDLACLDPVDKPPRGPSASAGNSML